MKANELTSETFSTTLASTTQPVLIDFHAEWCGPCKMLGPIIDQVANDQSGNSVVAKLNIDNAPEIAARYAITSIPALIVFKDGQPVASSRGVQSKGAIEKLIAQAV
jgi:thioredoxin 1